MEVFKMTATESEKKWLARFIDLHGDIGIDNNGEPYISVEHDDYESVMQS
jgi:hypothetical protein